MASALLDVVHQHGSVIIATVITTLAVLSAAKWTFGASSKKILPSPRAVLAHLPDEKQSWFIYPSNAMPGRRDVKTPYGYIRVNEWGPEDGTRVVLIHGIAIPSPVLGRIAEGLVAKGCRVLLFDLWGRGYSDSVADLPHDERLFTSELLLAIASSPVSWLGGKNGGFHLIGYSFGGGLAANFASYFPDVVKSLVLLAPAGILRSHRTATGNPLFNSGLIPDKVLGNVALKKIVASENAPDSVSPIAAKPQVKAKDLIDWQVEMHSGFITSFLSTLRYGPLSGQEAEWKQLSKRDQKTVIFVGTRDTVVDATELKTDAEKIIGKDKIEWRTIEGTHEFPASKSEQVISEISSLWGL